MRGRLSSLAVVGLALGWLGAEMSPAQEFTSGLKPGQLLGGAFSPYNLNGKRAKGRPHYPVTEFGLDPVIAIFIREGAEPNDKGVSELLTKTNDAVKRLEDLYFLHSFACFLTPDARSSATEKKVEDPEVLVKEALARDKLYKRLAEVAEPLPHVLICCHPPDSLPKGWNVSKEPGVTVMVYAAHRVVSNHAFAEGKLQSADVDNILQNVEKWVKARKKKLASGK